MKNKRSPLNLFMNYYLILLVLGIKIAGSANARQNYADALSKSIMFFEGQRSGKIPSTQRLTWRSDSALDDGASVHVDLTGGYYDAGDNIKFNFPMAFTTTVLSWGIIEYGKSMGQPDLNHALDAVRWSTDYFLKATQIKDVVFAQVGDPNADHKCWQRPEDMDTPRTVYAVTKHAPGSELAAEIAASLAASAIVFRTHGNRAYANVLLARAIMVFEFADKYRGSYGNSVGQGACPFYCSSNGYEDELLWAAAWLYKATGRFYYWDYFTKDMFASKSFMYNSFSDFGWDAKHAGINILLSKFIMNNTRLQINIPFVSNADKFVCSVMPESPSNTWSYTPGGLMFKPGMVNLQHTSVTFVLLTYARYMKNTSRVVQCDHVIITPKRLVRFAKRQVDYILGDNPMNMSYMVGYGEKHPRRIHHRGSSLPSTRKHPEHIKCKEGSPYFLTENPNPNNLTGAVVGGPDYDDSFADDRVDAGNSEPATYVNAPIVGLLAFFRGRSMY